MVTVPAALAITFPLLLTVAIFVFEDFHVTALLVAVVGVTVAFNVRVSFGDMVAVVLFKVTFVTFTTGFVTVTLQVALTPLPSFAAQVMVAVPAALAVTSPLVLTVATLAFEVLQVTTLFVAFVGATVAVNFCVFPFVKARPVDVLNVILLTFTSAGVVVSRLSVYALILQL